jgi:hypothetical protein
MVSLSLLLNRIARVEDARPRGIVRHSSLAVPRVQLSWQQVVDESHGDAVPNGEFGAGVVYKLNAGLPAP